MHDLIHHSRADGSTYPKHECKIHEAFQEGKGVHIDNEVFWRADGTNFNAENGHIRLLSVTEYWEGL